MNGYPCHDMQDVEYVDTGTSGLSESRLLPKDGIDYNEALRIIE
jgi:hypothetical protein